MALELTANGRYSEDQRFQTMKKIRKSGKWVSDPLADR